MRKKMLCMAMLFYALFLATIADAQKDSFALAITDQRSTVSKHNLLHKLNLTTGMFNAIASNGSDVKLKANNIHAKEDWKAINRARTADEEQVHFGTDISAMAYDKKADRLYFTQTAVDQLRYLDLKTMKIYYVKPQSFTGHDDKYKKDEGKIVTRMIITPDGTGYAVSTDGTTFIKFTTGKKLQITQLGSLINDTLNGSSSIFDQRAGWGGSMVADDEGDLYIFSSSFNIFKIDVKTKIAKLLGHINGLPQGFIVSGAVVTPEGKILVSSMADLSNNQNESFVVDPNAYFIVDPKDWRATPYNGMAGIFRSSALANGNYLQPILTPKQPEPVNVTTGKIQVYPNPVVNDQFTIQFEKIPAGGYTIQVTNATGQIIIERTVNIQSEYKTEAITTRPVMAKGAYWVMIKRPDKTVALSQKIIVQ